MRKTHFSLYTFTFILLGLIFLTCNKKVWAIEEEQKKIISSSLPTRPTAELDTTSCITLADPSRIRVDVSAGERTADKSVPLTSHEIMYGKHSLLEITESVLKNPTYYLDKIVEVKIPRDLLKNIVEYSVKTSPGIQAGNCFDIYLLFNSGISFRYSFRPKVFFTP